MAEVSESLTDPLVNSYYTLLDSAKQDIKNFCKKGMLPDELRSALNETISASMFILKECLSDGVYSKECIEKMEEIFGEVEDYQAKSGRLGIDDMLQDFRNLSLYATSNGYKNVGVEPFLKEVGKSIEQALHDFGVGKLQASNY